MHYPRLHKKAEKNLNKAEASLKQISAEFNALEIDLLASDFPKYYGNHLDKNSLARLLIVYQLTYNQSLSQLESIYLHKTAKSKLTFGPIWDFDSAYGGSDTQEYFAQGASADLFNSEELGAKYFQYLLTDPELYTIFIHEWQEFKKTGLNELKVFMADYVNLLESSGAYKRDFSRWHKEQDTIKESPRKKLRAYEDDMKKWLKQRVLHIDTFADEWQKSLETH